MRGDTVTQLLTDAQRLEAIALIHRPSAYPDESTHHCIHCRFAWPCPTRRALEGDPHAVDHNMSPGARPSWRWPMSDDERPLLYDPDNTMRRRPAKDET
jgi:hypothetical protein